MWLAYIANALVSSTWIFFIIFGNVKETQQLRSLVLTCDDDTEHGYYFNDQCQGNQVYRNRYHILSLAGSILGFTQIYYFTRHLFYTLVAKHIFDAAFFFKTYIINSSFITPLIASLYAYHYLQYAVFFCHVNAMFCEQRPFIYDIVQDIYLGMVIMLSIYLVTQLCAICMFFYFFFHIHYDNWKHIKYIENMLFYIKEQFETTDVTLNFFRTPHIKHFIRTWREKNEDDIEDDIHEKATQVIYALRKVIEDDEKTKKRISIPPPEKDDDNENEEGKVPVFNTCYKSDTPIYFEDKDRVIFASEKNDIVSSQLWTFLTHQNKYDKCCVLSVKDALYTLFFRRKSFANRMFTDLYIITAIFKYISFFLYPIGIIAITRIFGYENGFGTGVDLFKTYLVGVSIVTSKMMLPLRFLGLMITQRPFNIGDVIVIDNKTFKVHTLNLSHTYLQGSYSLIVPNDLFIGNSTINLTCIDITDSFDIQVPLTVLHHEFNANIALTCLEEYNQKHPEDIKMDSVRCGWVSTTDGTKTMRYNWRYHFQIHNRSRLNRTRRQIYNFLCEKCSMLMAKHFINIHIAGGGGFNDVLGEQALKKIV